VLVHVFNPAIEFGLKDDSGPDCNRAAIFRNAREKFSIADFEHDIPSIYPTYP